LRAPRSFPTRRFPICLLAAGAAVAVLGAVVLAGVLPADGFLRDPLKPDFKDTLFMRGLVAFIFLFGFVPGVAYGVAAGTIRNDRSEEHTSELQSRENL